jgi:hypothetical protein
MAKHQFTDKKEEDSSFISKAGEYHFTVTKCQEGIKGGKECISYTAMSDSGKVNDTLFFTAAAAWRIDVFLKACGFVLTKGQEVDVNGELLLNRQFKAKVEMGKPNEKGDSYPEIKRFILPEKGTIPIPGAKADDDDEQF